MSRITDTTSSIGRGPMSLDLEMAREHGWTDQRINDFWEEIGCIYDRNSRELQGERPDLHAIAGDGSIVHTSSKFRSHGDTRYQRRTIRLHQIANLPNAPYAITAPPAEGEGVEMDAYVVGDWAAHRALGEPGWSITYVPHGTGFPAGELDVHEARRAICHVARLARTFDPYCMDDLRYVEAVVAQVLAFEDLSPDTEDDFPDKQGDIF